MKDNGALTSWSQINGAPHLGPSTLGTMTMARSRGLGRNRKKKHKICHHSPSCNKLLAYSSRLRHYRFADLSKIRPSESPEPSSQNGNETVSEEDGKSSSPLGATPSFHATRSQISSASPSPSIQRRHSLESQSAESGSEEASSGGIFDEGDRVSLDEMMADLAGIMGLEGAAELWQLSEFGHLALLHHSHKIFNRKQYHQ